MRPSERPRRAKEARAAAEPRTLAEQAYVRLRDDIMRGLFPTGEPLRLEALRTRYGYSFSPLREALSRLCSERLIEMSALKGFRMSTLSLDELHDAIETRIHVETEALRLSIKQGGVDWESKVVGAFHSLLRCFERPTTDEGGHDDDARELERRHRDFHFALISASGSGWLNEFAAQLYAQVELYRRSTLGSSISESHGGRHVPTEHQLLMDTAIGRDAASASELLTQHYRSTGQMIEAKMQARTHAGQAPPLVADR